MLNEVKTLNGEVLNIGHSSAALHDSPETEILQNASFVCVGCIVEQESF